MSPNAAVNRTHAPSDARTLLLVTVSSRDIQRVRLSRSPVQLPWTLPLNPAYALALRCS